jgi:hypothetical protein
VIGARGPARHDPLANPGRAGTVLIHVGSSRTRAGPARPAHLDIYRVRVSLSNITLSKLISSLILLLINPPKLTKRIDAFSNFLHDGSTKGVLLVSKVEE